MYEFNGRFTPLEDLSPKLVRNLNQALESPDPISMVETALLSASTGTRGGDVVVAEAVRHRLRAWRFGYRGTRAGTWRQHAPTGETIPEGGGSSTQIVFAHSAF